MGRIESTSKNLCLNFVVTKFKDISEKSLFFDKYPIQGIKLLDFLDFKEITGLIKNKTHLTKEGLREIIYKIKNKSSSYLIIWSTIIKITYFVKIDKILLNFIIK